MKNIIITFVMVIMSIGIGWGQLPSSSDSLFNGKWTIFTQAGPEYSLDYNFYDYTEDPDIIGSFVEENCMDCYAWKLRKSRIISESESSITFKCGYGDSGEANYVITLTINYDPVNKNVTVTIDGKQIATFNEDTHKLKYWYAREESDVMRTQEDSSVISHVKAGDRFELDKWTNPFLENRIRIKLPNDTYGWIKSDHIEEGVTEPIKSSAFPLSWEYEDKLGEETIKIKKTEGKKVIVSYVNIKYNNTGVNEESQYSGTIKGNRIILTKWRPLHFKGKFTKMPEKKEMVLIPDLYLNGMWRTKLLFEGHEFIPTRVKEIMNGTIY